MKPNRKQRATSIGRLRDRSRWRAALEDALRARRRVRHDGELLVVTWPAIRKGTGNPYNWRLAEELEAHGVTVADWSRLRAVLWRPDVIHVHWPEFAVGGRALPAAVVNAALVLAALAVARRRGAVVVWTAHNLGAHEASHARLLRAYLDRFVRQVDAVTVMTEAGAKAVRSRFPKLARRPVVLAHHGDYRSSYPSPTPRAEARARLGIADEARVALFFGQVRPYKDVPALLRAFRGLEDPAARLVVAGRPLSPAVGEELWNLAVGDHRIELRLDFVAAETVPLLFGAADLVVLPYAEILNSGAAMLALSFDRPVLLPRTAVFEEIRELVGAGWVHLYESPLDVGALDQALDEARAVGGTAPDLGAFSWDRVAAATLDCYREAQASRTLSRR